MASTLPSPDTSCQNCHASARDSAAEVLGHFAWPNPVHPSAIVDRLRARLGRGVMVAPAVVGSVNWVLDDFALVNMGSQFGHDAQIGCGSVVNPAASISAGVVLEDGVLVSPVAQPPRRSGSSRTR